MLKLVGDPSFEPPPPPIQQSDFDVFSNAKPNEHKWLLPVNDSDDWDESVGNSDIFKGCDDTAFAIAETARHVLQVQLPEFHDKKWRQSRIQIFATYVIILW